MKPAITLSMVLFGVGLALGASAAPREFLCSIQNQSGTTLQISTTEEIAGESVLLENEVIVLAEFSLHDALPAGTQVEIWPQVEGEVAPWDLDPEAFPFRRDLWTTDERTESLLRFDVTAIARAWQAAELPNLGFVLRIIDQPEVEGQAAGQPSAGGFKSPKGAVLVLHGAAVRPPKDDPTDKQRDPRKVPDAEDGSGEDN